MPDFRRIFRVQGMDSDANPRFQMVPTAGSRYVALHDGADMTVTSSDLSICTVTEIREADLPADDRATGRDRFFRLDGKTKGVCFLTAIRVPLLPLLLEVGVKDKLTQHGYTHSRLPVEVVYQEAHVSRGSALRREAAIKALSRREKKTLIRLELVGGMSLARVCEKNVEDRRGAGCCPGFRGDFG